MGEVGPVALVGRYATLAGAEAWAAFLLASYFLGHLVFLLGSLLDVFYDYQRAHVPEGKGEILRRRHGSKLSREVRLVL